ncbi:class I SAM-dependent methyltransferase [Acidimangrovimonas pyrenivorans]|uniref:Class I SAM-dependent methyltransferase n=1 Tax=Acidimangrovimonas pyrenivorans TaxID=2030798 RepID=A0ABV7AIT9_9RHOB
MGFFDFIGDLAGYEDANQPVARMNARHEMIVTPFAEEIRGARVLDLAAHDGRWSYALAGAGAAQVVGVEARPELIARFPGFPDPELRAKVELRCNDLYDEIDAEAARGETYDVVAVYGILYHLMDHFRLFQGLRRLQPKLVIVDSEFIRRPNPMIQLVKERTDNVLNAAPQIEGQKVAVKGVPSFKAMELMAEALDYRIDWVDWDARPANRRAGVGDYYRDTKMRRATCALRPL